VLPNVHITVHFTFVMLKSYRFGTTWWWGHDDRIFIFEWTISGCQ